MPQCVICGEWEPIEIEHPECRRALNEKRVPPRILDARDRRLAVADLSEKALRAADLYMKFAVAMIFITALGSALLLSSASHGDGTTEAVVGAIIGSVAGYIHYQIAKVFVLDLHTRHAWMRH